MSQKVSDDSDEMNAEEAIERAERKGAEINYDEMVDLGEEEVRVIAFTYEHRTMFLKRHVGTTRGVTVYTEDGDAITEIGERFNVDEQLPTTSNQIETALDEARMELGLIEVSA